MNDFLQLEDGPFNAREIPCRRWPPAEYLNVDGSLYQLVHQMPVAGVRETPQGIRAARGARYRFIGEVGDPRS